MEIEQTAYTVTFVYKQTNFVCILYIQNEGTKFVLLENKFFIMPTKFFNFFFFILQSASVVKSFLQVI